MVLRILKTIATSGFLTALECTKFVFGRGSAPDPAGGAYSAPPYPIAGLRGLLLMERGKGGGGTAPFTQIPRSASAMGFFYDNVTGGGIRLKAHGRGIKRGTPGSRLAARHYPICIYC